MNVTAQVVLLRHATRSAVLEFGSGESSLNAIGLAQAEDFADAVRAAGKLPRPDRLLTSPKQRARQTLEPLSKALALPLIVEAALDERRDNESLEAFEKRVREIFESIRSHRGVSYLCTHLDVLEAASLLWPTDFSAREQSLPWSTLEYQIFDLRDGVLRASSRNRIEPRRHR
jgi:phosphohistidine phosphatase SixA